jgi:hypothetical protein
MAATSLLTSLMSNSAGLAFELMVKGDRFFFPEEFLDRDLVGFKGEFVVDHTGRQTNPTSSPYRGLGSGFV